MKQPNSLLRNTVLPCCWLIILSKLGIPNFLTESHQNTQKGNTGNKKKNLYTQTQNHFRDELSTESRVLFYLTLLVMYS